MPLGWPPRGERQASALAGDIVNDDISHGLEAEIARFQRLGGAAARHMQFSPRLERAFVRDTRAVRIRELRFTMVIGTCLYFLTTVTDMAFVPDLGIEPFLIRALALPLMAICVFLAGSMPIRVLEALIPITVALIVLLLSLIPTLSMAPTAPIAFATAGLAFICANTMVAIRVRYAVPFTLFSCAVITVFAVAHQGLMSPVGWAIGVQAIIAGLFSLVAILRIERGARLSYLNNMREVLRLKALADDRNKLEALSRTDALTGLANRGAFYRASESIFSDERNMGRPVTLLMIDVDYFKRYNDRYGHIAGDQCLRRVAGRIAELARDANDIVARHGGEEFVVLLPDVGPAKARTLAKRMCSGVEALRIPHENRPDDLAHVTISVGIATATIGAPGALHGLLETADQCLYGAKARGRNTVETSLSSVA